MPTFEDKVLQRSVAMVLEAVYEQDFLDCSYKFRPGRSPHQAVQAVWKQAMDLGGCWVLEADIEDFFGCFFFDMFRWTITTFPSCPTKRRRFTA